MINYTEELPKGGDTTESPSIALGFSLLKFEWEAATTGRKSYSDWTAKKPGTTASRAMHHGKPLDTFRLGLWHPTRVFCNPAMFVMSLDFFVMEE
jgi:hypothetical protein